MYLPVITRNSPNKLQFMRWGFVPGWAKSGFSMINIRSETIQTQDYFGKKLMEGRCLIPADGFYEWKRTKTRSGISKTPYYIFLKNHTLFSFAGIYNEVKDAEGKPIATFAIITCKPNILVSEIHNRMPVILSKKDEDAWLNTSDDPKTFTKLMSAYPPAKMELHKVSFDVNSPENDSPSLINPIL